MKIPIRNNSLPDSPRIFDVTVDRKGRIIRYDVKHIKGALFVDEIEVQAQIKQALEKEIS